MSTCKKGINRVEGLKPLDLYTKDGTDVWEIVTIFTEPSVLIRNMRTDEIVNAAIGSPALVDFVSLVPLKG